MAEAACYSLFHFCRVFGSVVHLTPYDYLMRRRLSAAAVPLMTGSQPVTAVAFEHGFATPETFTRAFRRLFGALPSQARAPSAIDPRFLVGSLADEGLLARRSECENPVAEKLRPPALTGMTTLVGEDSSAIDRLWVALEAELDRQAIAAQRRLGVWWYPEAWPERGRIYAAVVEAPGVDVAFPLMRLTTPAGEHARFRVSGDLQATRSFAYEAWLPRGQGALDVPYEIEIYGDADRPAADVAPEALLIPVPADARSAATDTSSPGAD